MLDGATQSYYVSGKRRYDEGHTKKRAPDGARSKKGGTDSYLKV